MKQDELIQNIRDIQRMYPKVGDVLAKISGIEDKIEKAEAKHQKNIRRLFRPGYEKSDEKIALKRKADLEAGR